MVQPSLQNEINRRRRTDTHWAPPAAAASYTSPADLSAMLVPKSFLMTKG